MENILRFSRPTENQKETIPESIAAQWIPGVFLHHFLKASCLKILARRKILCKRYSTKSRMALESRADSGLNPLFTESHGGQNGMRVGTA